MSCLQSNRFIEKSLQGTILNKIDNIRALLTIRVNRNFLSERLIAQTKVPENHRNQRQSIPFGLACINPAFLFHVENEGLEFNHLLRGARIFLRAQTFNPNILYNIGQIQENLLCTRDLANLLPTILQKGVHFRDSQGTLARVLGMPSFVIGTTNKGIQSLHRHVVRGVRNTDFRLADNRFVGCGNPLLDQSTRKRLPKVLRHFTRQQAQSPIIHIEKLVARRSNCNGLRTQDSSHRLLMGCTVHSTTNFRGFCFQAHVKLSGAMRSHTINGVIRGQSHFFRNKQPAFDFL